MATKRAEANRTRTDAGTIASDAAAQRAGAGPLIYQLEPRFAGAMATLTDHLPRVAAMGFDTVYITPASLTSANRTEFVAAARRIGLDVMADLVLDVATSDAVTAQLSKVVRPLLHSGVRGFRCVAAHRIPAEVWRALIAAARAKVAQAFFCADTLGAPIDSTLALKGAGFDFVFNSVAWWDWRSPWFFEQQHLLQTVAPTIGFPTPPGGDSAATRVPGVNAADPKFIGAELRHRYALAAICSTGLLVPMGYEWGWRPPLFDVALRPVETPSDPLFDLTGFITAFNQMRRESPALLAEGPLRLLSPANDPVVALARSSSDGTAWSFMLINRDVERARAVATDTLLAAGGESPLALTFRTPAGGEPVAALQIELEPMAVCLLAGDAGSPTAVTESPSAARHDRQGRIVIENVGPAVDGGRFPVKRIVGDDVEVSADILRDGHDVLAAVVRYRKTDAPAWRLAPMRHIDNDRWGGRFAVEEAGRFVFVAEAWTDHFASWRNDVTKNAAAGQDIALALIEGRALLAGAKERADEKDALAFEALLAAIDAASAEERTALMLSRLAANLVARWSDRSDAVATAELEILVNREAARFAAWYEMFPRSQGRIAGQSATFDDCIARLPEIAALGFDVVYLVPIHPIGRINRKGRDNAPTAAPGDPGSPYAIGAAEGGHCAINPELGTLDDFRRFIAAAKMQGIEVALDFAVQCAPDHPWIRDHPQWFTFRPDGTIKYAENPPKKYQDIVNVDFYNPDRRALWRELRNVIQFWAREGVRIFRVDNPHTKPVPFWEWCIREVLTQFPDTIFLSEAFTRPKMMKLLAKVGFTQSYSYFTWRNDKRQLTEYLTELTRGPEREYMLPNFFTNTPDILPRILQEGGRPAFRIRLVLAATLSSAYGIYNGFELCENAAIPGTEEYLHSEKYEYKVWDWDRSGNIKAEIAALNRFRRENPALRLFTNLTFCETDDDHILAYVKRTPDRSNVVLAVVNLDPFAAHEAEIDLALDEIGIAPGQPFRLQEALSDASLDWQGARHRLRLDPQQQPAVVFRLTPR